LCNEYGFGDVEAGIHAVFGVFGAMLVIPII
jgi:hypothetical protein